MITATRLGRAVVLRAIEDLRKPKYAVSAREFLYNSDVMLKMWCDIGNIDFDRLRTSLDTL